MIFVTLMALGRLLDEPEQYIEHMLWIRDERSQVIPFYLNDVQRFTLAEERRAVQAGRPPHFLHLKARRGGITTLKQAQNFHAVATHANRNAVTLAHETEVTEKIFRISNLFYEKLPPEFCPIRLTEHSKRNLDFPALNSLFYIGTAGKRGFGRGDTIDIVHWSEVAYSRGSREEQAVTLAGLTEACKYGSISLETTANGQGDLFEHLCMEALAGRGEWTLIFIPWWKDSRNRIQLAREQMAEMLETLSDEERELVKLHAVDVEQIAWRRKKRRELGYLFDQEYPEDPRTAFIASGTCFFNTRVVSSLLRGLQDIEPRHLPGGLEFRWEEPQKGVEYVIGGDTSEGLPGCDPNGLGVLRKDTGAQVASIHGLFSIPQQAEIAIRLSKEYNEALLGIERENHGHAVLQKIKDLGYGRSHFEGGSLFFYPTSEGGYKSARPGWDTNGTTRPVMLAALAEAIEQRTSVIRDKQLLMECLKFKLQPNGKWEGQPDDSVMKWAIARQMLKHRKLSAGFAYMPLGI